MIAALERRSGPEVRTLIDWRPDAHLIEMIDAMPKGFTSSRAIAAGIEAETSFDAVLDDFIAAHAGRGDIPILNR